MKGGLISGLVVGTQLVGTESRTSGLPRVRDSDLAPASCREIEHGLPAQIPPRYHAAGQGVWVSLQRSPVCCIISYSSCCLSYPRFGLVEQNADVVRECRLVGRFGRVPVY